MVSLTALTNTARAAKIEFAMDRNGRFLSGILIEGAIEKGDFMKFASLALTSSEIGRVYLASPGGDLQESLKIGRLIRSLYLETWAPLTAESSLLKLSEKTNNMCASSCFYIYAAGTRRFGRVLGVHRPYLPPEEYRKMGLSNAESSHTVVRQLLEKYFKEMNIPNQYLDQIMAISSDRVEWIPEVQIRKELEGFTPAISEWMSANCKKLEPSDERRLENILKSIPKERSHLPMREAPAKASDREFIVAYHKRMGQQRECEEGGFTREREVVRAKLLQNMRELGKD